MNSYKYQDLLSFSWSKLGLMRIIYICEYQTEDFNKETKKSYVYSGGFSTNMDFVYNYNLKEFDNSKLSVFIHSEFKDAYVIQSQFFNVKEDNIHSDFELYSNEATSNYLLNMYSGEVELMSYEPLN